MSFQKIGPFEIFGWSIAGNETCVAVRAGNNIFGFDIGFAPRPLILADHIFISHGHADHIGAIGQHMKKRALNKLEKTKYFMPTKLITHVKTICEAFEAMNENPNVSDFKSILIPMEPGERHELSNNWFVEAIQTDHSITSLGYLLYSRESDGSEIPQIAYLGDSRFTVLKNASSNCSDLLSVNLLIMEATFLDKAESRLERVRSYGHTHLVELSQNASLFKLIQHIYLIHISDRYNCNDILRLYRNGIPSWLADRIIPSIFAKQCLEWK